MKSCGACGGSAKGGVLPSSGRSSRPAGCVPPAAPGSGKLDRPAELSSFPGLSSPGAARAKRRRAAGLGLARIMPALARDLVGPDMSAAADCAVVFRDLTLTYERHPAVHHLSGALARGSLTAIVGPNGAGESALLKGIVG